MKKNSLKRIVFFSSLVILLSSIILVFYFNYFLLDVVYVNFDFKVKEDKNIGFNLDQDALHFGIIPPGSNSHRDLVLNSEVPARLLIKVFGSNYVYPTKNNFLIEPGESTLTFTASPPVDMPKGNYSGKIRLVFKKV